MLLFHAKSVALFAAILTVVVPFQLVLLFTVHTYTVLLTAVKLCILQLLILKSACSTPFIASLNVHVTVYTVAFWHVQLQLLVIVTLGAVVSYLTYITSDTAETFHATSIALNVTVSFLPSINVRDSDPVHVVHADDNAQFILYQLQFQILYWIFVTVLTSVVVIIDLNCLLVQFPFVCVHPPEIYGNVNVGFVGAVLSTIVTLFHSKTVFKFHALSVNDHAGTTIFNTQSPVKLLNVKLYEYTHQFNQL